MPFDQLATNRTGQREAPWHIRTVASWPHELLPISVTDMGDAKLYHGDVAMSQQEMATLMFNAYNHANKGVVLLGGDDSVNLTALNLLAQTHGQVDLIVLDAHVDCYQGNDHSSWLREAIDMNLLHRVSLHGVRMRNPAWERRLVVEYADYFHPRIFDVTYQGPRFLAIDIDVVDPAYAPGTGYPEPFGVTPHQVRDAVKVLCRMASSLPVVMSVTEVLPACDTSNITSLLANRLVVEFLRACSCW